MRQCRHGETAAAAPRGWPQYARAQRATAHYAELLARSLAAPAPAGRALPALVAAGQSCISCDRLDGCMLWLKSGAPAGAGPDCGLADLAAAPLAGPARGRELEGVCCA